MQRFISLKVYPSVDKISQVTSLGFEVPLAVFALRKMDYNVNEAVNAILNGTINFTSDNPQRQNNTFVSSRQQRDTQPMSSVARSQPNSSPSAMEDDGDDISEESEGDEQEEEDIDRVIDEEIIGAVDKDENNDFEVDLSEELQVLETYQQFVNK